MPRYDHKKGTKTFRYFTNVGPYHKTHGVQEYINSHWSLARHVANAISQVHPTVVAQMTKDGKYADYMVYVYPESRKLKSAEEQAKLDLDWRPPIVVNAPLKALERFLEEFDVVGWRVTPIVHVQDREVAETHMRRFYVGSSESVEKSVVDEKVIKEVVKRIRARKQKPLLYALGLLDS